MTANRIITRITDPRAANDNVVHHGDIKCLSGGDECLGGAQIVVTGFGITARMVVNEDDRGGAQKDGATERYLSERFPELSEETPSESVTYLCLAPIGAR